MVSLVDCDVLLVNMWYRVLILTLFVDCKCEKQQKRRPIIKIIHLLRDCVAGDRGERDRRRFEASRCPRVRRCASVLGESRYYPRCPENGEICELEQCDVNCQIEIIKHE